MNNKLLAIMISGLFLLLTVGAFSCATAENVEKKSIETLDDEGTGSIKVTFKTMNGEDFLISGKFQIDLIFSIPNNKYYHDWLTKDGESSSVLIENLPSGVYKIYQYAFGAGFIAFPKYVIVGQGNIIPEHRDVTVKIIKWC